MNLKFNKENFDEMLSALCKVSNHFFKYNKLQFNKYTSNKMADILVKKFGFTDKKDYSYIPQYANDGMIQTYDWNKGDGTLWHDEIGKIEIGKHFENSNGWYCPDFKYLED